MAAYRSAARMVGRAHVPSLCIASEYLRVNNLALALKFAAAAERLCAADPLVWHETGVARYKSGEAAPALACFLRALALLGPQGPRRPDWEPAFYNAAHCLRRLRNYPEALR